MSQENVEIVKLVHPPSGTDLAQWFGAETDAESRFRAAEALFDPGFEFIADDAQAIAQTIAPVGHGLSELATAWREWMRPWEAYRTEVEGFVDAGEDRVVVLVRDYGRLRGSANEVETVGGAVWTVRDGRIARIEFFLDRRKALEAAGLLD